MTESKTLQLQCIELKRIYQDLCDFGYKMEDESQSDARLQKATFKSTKFQVTISLDILLNELFVFWYVIEPNQSLQNKTTCPEPVLGVLFFSNGVEEILSKYELSTDIVSTHEITMNLYKRFPFFIQNNSWTADLGFCKALNSVNEWMYQEQRLLNRWEYENKLISYKS